MEVCAPNIEREVHKDKMEKLWQTWSNPNKNTYKVHGNGKQSRKTMEEWVETILEKPFHEDFTLSKGEHARLELELKIYNKRIDGRFVNKFEDIAFVPEGISLKDPIARSFYKSLYNALDYERVNLGKANGLQRSVARFLREAYIQEGYQGRWETFGIKHFKKIEELSRKIESSDNIRDRELYEIELGKVVDADEARGMGSILNQFKSLMTMTNKDFNVSNFEYTNVKGEAVRYNDQVVQAAVAGRKMLTDMGHVTIDGLKYFKKAVQLKYFGTSDKDLMIRGDITYKRFEKAIDEAITRLEVSLDPKTGGGYLPSYVMSDLIAMKASMTDYMNVNTKNKHVQAEKLTTLESALNSISVEQIPQHALAAHPKIHQKYKESPLFILQQYAQDAVAFNKLSFTQASYLETMNKFVNSKDKQLQWVDGMKKWINEEFQIATEGLTSRPEWMNETVRTLQGIQIVRTMGLNLTGAIVNATSIQYAASHMGFVKMAQAKWDYGNSHTVRGESFRDIVNKVEKRSGFLFNDVASELVSEGLLPAKGINTADYTFNVEKGSFEYQGTPALEKMKAGLNWTIEKGLTFHRITENWTRRWMFRTAFMDKYRMYTENTKYIENVEFAGKKGFDAAEAKAAAWALEFVNRYAFEYAIFAKAKLMRGVPAVDTYGDKVIAPKVSAGFAGQLSFQLLHYPMSLAQQQSRNIRAARRALKSGQYDAPELLYMYRQFGLASALAIGSVLTNVNLFNMIPNETVQRLQQIEDDFTVPLDPKSKEETFGLIGEFTGPWVGTAKWALMVSQVLGTDPGYMEKVLLGNIDYTKDPGKRLNWYQLSTEVGRFVTKTWPSIEDGRGIDLFRHYLRLYPGELPIPGMDFTTKDARKMLYDEYGIEFFKPGRKGRKKKASPVRGDILKALNLLEQN